MTTSPQVGTPGKPRQSRHSVSRNAAIAIAIITAVVLGIIVNAHKDDDKIGLTGNVRAAFVNSAAASCQKSQLAMPENKDIPLNVLADYCRCYSDSMADRVSINDVNSSAGVTPANIPEKFRVLANAASESCFDRVR